jgi:hypothetical protein
LSKYESNLKNLKKSSNMKDFPYMEPLEHGLYEVFLFPTQLTKHFKEGATPKWAILFEGLAMRVVAPILKPKENITPHVTCPSST